MFARFAEGSSDEIELKGDIAEPGFVAQALHFAYFKTVSMTPKNVQDLLGLAIYLQMEALQEQCTRFIRQRIDRDNCVSLYLLTGAAGPPDLNRFAEDFILSNFDQIVNRGSSAKDFVHLPVETLKGLLANDRLTAASEGAVFKAVQRWVYHDLKNRGRHLTGLLELVHFPLMSQVELKQFGRKAATKRNVKLSEAFDEARKYSDNGAKEKLG